MGYSQVPRLSLHELSLPNNLYERNCRFDRRGYIWSTANKLKRPKKEKKKKALIYYDEKCLFRWREFFKILCLSKKKIMINNTYKCLVLIILLKQPWNVTCCIWSMPTPSIKPKLHFLQPDFEFLDSVWI